MAENRNADFFNEVIRKAAETQFKVLHAFIQRYPNAPGKTDQLPRMTEVDMQRLKGGR